MNSRLGKKIILKSDIPDSMSLMTLPERVEFATQDSDEDIYIIARRSLLTLVSWFFTSIFYLLLPIIISVAISQINPNLFSIVPINYILFGLALYFAFIFSYSLTIVINWYHNVFIVTNKRIIYYQFVLFSSKNVSEANLDKIEDVSQSVIGIGPSFFDYGDLVIQTAGQRTKFEIKSVPKPTWLRDIIVDLVRTGGNEEP